MKDRDLEKELRLFKKDWTEEGDEEGEKRFLAFLCANKWRINVAGSTLTGVPVYICTMPINCNEPVMSIIDWDGLLQIEITAPLSQFTREK